MISLEYKTLTLYSGTVPILDDINLRIDGPGVFALLGPSGAGKSSLLRATQRLIDGGRDNWHRTGDIYFNGKSIFAHDVKKHELARQIGYIPQRPRMLHGSVRANAEFALRHTTRLSRGEIRDIAHSALEQVGLTDELPNLKQSAWKLSGGQAQRLAIARAIVLNPAVLLMDEPTTGLDPMKVQTLEQIIRKMALQRLVVLVTHDVEIAERLADSVAFIFRGVAGGRLVESGLADEVFARPINPAVQEFIALGRSKQVNVQAPLESGVATSPAPLTPQLQPSRSGRVREILIGTGLHLLQRVYLFVCDGNATRSPMAQAICNNEIARLLKLSNVDSPAATFRAFSAGLKIRPGSSMLSAAQTVLSQMGVRFDHHSARHVSSEMVQQASAVFCMTDSQCREMSRRFPDAAARIKRLDADGDIEDPKKPNLDIFRAMAERIRRSVLRQLENEIMATLSQA